MKIKLLLIAGVIAILVGCNSEENPYNSQPSISDNMMILPDDEEIIDFLSTLEPKPLIMHPSPVWLADENRWLYSISLLDLLTGEILASYEFSEDEHFSSDLWDLGEGFYAIKVWENDENFSAIEQRIIILDVSLNMVDTLFYDVDLFLGLHTGFLKLENSELIVYMIEPGGEFQGVILNPLRVNLHTEEVEVLAEVDEFIHMMHRYVGENKIFVTDSLADFNTGHMSTKYGILDLVTGSVHFLEKEGFRHSHLGFTDDQVLISESTSVGPPLLNEVVLFDLNNMSSESIQLGEEESIWARFSYDGNYIVTINQEESRFKKYDFSGNMIVEMEIYLTSTVSGIDVFSEEHLILTTNQKNRFFQPKLI